MDFRKTDTAVVFIDPQNDVLSENGANWGAVGASVTENRTVENMERIFEAAKARGYDVFISPHYFYPTDNGWKMNGPLEADEFKTHTFSRSGPLNLTGFANSGAGWIASSHILKTARQSSSARTRCSGRRPTIWSCNCASVGSVKSSSVVCWRTCASSRIFASSLNRASRSPWSRTQPPGPGIQSGAMAIMPRSSTTNFSRTPFCRPTKRSMPCGDLGGRTYHRSSGACSHGLLSPTAVRNPALHVPRREGPACRHHKGGQI